MTTTEQDKKPDALKKAEEFSFDNGATTCVALEGANVVWSVGKDIISCWVQLGMDDKASQCEVTVSDLTAETFEKLVNHSLKSGGIVALGGSSSYVGTPTAVSDTNTTPLAGGTPSNLPAAPGGLTAKGQKYAAYLKNPGVLAALDAIARAELGADKMDRYDLGYGFRKVTTYPNSHPFYGSELTPQGISSASGRFQFMGHTWEEFDKKLGLGGRFDATAQTIAAIALLDRRGALQYAANGDWANVSRRVQQEWTSIDSPESRAPQAQSNGAYAVTSKVYAQRYAQYSGGQTPKLEPTPAQAGNQGAVAPTQAIPVETPIIKGNKLYVYHKGYTYTYYHQGTDYDITTGYLTIKGTGVRFDLAQRKRNRTETNTSLKAYAQKVCTAHKLTLDWQAPIDIEFAFLDQSGVSDLDRLKQECKKAGLFLSDGSSQPTPPGSTPKPATITIKALSNIQDTQVVLSRGTCLISAKMSDEPLDGSKQVPDNGSSLLQPESKTTINPITSQVETKLPDIDKAKDTTTTGAKTPATDAQVKPGQEVIQATQQARVKRVKGLPSSFVVNTTDIFLGLTPLSAVRTAGASFPGILSRVWMVDTIKHDFVAGTSELKCFSPIEVIDASPPPVASTLTEQPVSTFTPQQGLVIPVTGVGSSPYGWRKSTGTFHAGFDIAQVGSYPVIAVADGVVAYSGTYKGYGNTVDIQHSNSLLSRTAHLTTRMVSKGQPVKQGQQIGVVDQNWTGSGSGQHVHFELRKALDFQKGSSFDPSQMMPSLRVGNSVKVGNKA